MTLPKKFVKTTDKIGRIIRSKINTVPFYIYANYPSDTEYPMYTPLLI